MLHPPVQLSLSIGLIDVLLKGKNVRRTHYLMRWNAISFLSVLLLMSCFHWDVIIARYNFAHADRAFVHLKFLQNLTPQAVPYFVKSREELAAIDERNEETL